MIEQKKEDVNTSKRQWFQSHKERKEQEGKLRFYRCYTCSFDVLCVQSLFKHCIYLLFSAAQRLGELNFLDSKKNLGRAIMKKPASVSAVNFCRK